MKGSKGDLGADWAIGAMRFRALMGRELPGTRGRYVASAVDDLRNDAVAFVESLEDQLQPVMERLAVRADAERKRVEAAMAQAAEATQRADLLETENREAKLRISELEQTLAGAHGRPDMFDDAAAEVAGVLREAAEAASRTRRRAEEEVEDMLDAARREAAELREGSQHEVDEARAHADRIRDEANADADRVRAEATAGAADVRERAASDAAFIRDEAERLAAMTIEDAANLERSSRERADALVGEATRESAEMVEHARHEVDELEAVEAQLRAGLAAAGQWLLNSARLTLGETPSLNLGTLEQELAHVTGQVPTDEASISS